MGSRAVHHQEQQRGGVQQKNVQGERRSRTALGDIGNVVPGRGGVTAVNGVGKPQGVNRPLTRSFCAQLLANAQAAADQKKKQGVQVVDVNAARKVGPVVAQKKFQEKKKSEELGASKTPVGVGKAEQKQVCKKKKSATTTSFLTARSKVPHKMLAG